MLALNTLLVVLDSIAAGVAVFAVAQGSIAVAAEANADVLAALDDQLIQRELTPAFARRADMITATALYSALQGAYLQRALDRHYGSVGSLNAFLGLSDARVHANLRLIGMAIDARHTMPPVVNPIGTWTGAGWTHIAGIDTTVYGEAPLEAVIDVQAAGATTYRLTVQNFDGTTETRDLAVGLELAGAALPIGGAGDRYVDVTAVELLTGVSSGSWRVRSMVERAIVL